MKPQAAARNPVHGTRKALLLPLGFTVIFLALGFASRASSNRNLFWTFIGVAAFLLGWQVVLFLLAGRKKLAFQWEYVPVPSHYVQASVQLAIYVYWGWYWRNVYSEALLIFSQLAFLYVLDALVTWSRGQSWRLGFGPWPIIFSTNLFMWFRDDWYVLQFLMVAAGVLGKQYIRWRRDGKITHIFNPSAFGLTLFSLALIFTGTTHHTWGEQIAVTQARPPHIFMEIFLCGMVVQYFFLVTLLTFSATAVLCLLSFVYTQATGVYWFVDANIPIAIFLGLHLLMTDPATTPRSSLGRIMFGSLYGASVFWAYLILRILDVPEFYDKLLVVPILNLLTPVLDRLAGRGWAEKFGRWEAKVGARKMNLAFMGGWAALFLVMLTTGFVEAPNPGATIGFWKKAAEEKRPMATANLVHLLNEFSHQDLDDPSNPVGVASGGGNLSRPQILGILCNQVATIYTEGKFVPADYAKAAHYFARSCEYGNSDGCANFALQYLAGRSQAETEADVSLALSTLEKTSLESTNGRMSFLVGYSYEYGRGHAADKTKARQFYTRGAELGDLEAWKTLARMQLAGEGGPVDRSNAAVWLQKAADFRDGQSCLLLARLYHNGEGVPKDEQRANALLEKACNLGVQPACLLLQQAKR